MDLLLTFAAVVAPLVLAWYLLGRGLDSRDHGKRGRRYAARRCSPAVPTVPPLP